MLLHRFEQRRLGLGRRAVDLVGQDDVREDRTLDELHRALAARRLLQDLRAGDVRRHQVGRELDPLELRGGRFARERLDEQRLGQARGAGHEAVAAREQADQELLDRLRFLADDRPWRARWSMRSRLSRMLLDDLLLGVVGVDRVPGPLLSGHSSSACLPLGLVRE